ncbi:MAG: ImmA/IrrE family metallo-endopeptidase [Clostridiales bacterium]|nr:ImmA/IrrE family metallo-endopeptidase [Clostridiales bacterium]
MIKNAGLIRYKKAYAESQNFLSVLNVSGYPYKISSLMPLIKELYGFDITIASLGDLNAYRATKYKLPYNTDDGSCKYSISTNEYNIIYNEKQPEKRIRFTIMHEIAHIILGHVGAENPILSRDSTTDYQKLLYEAEANTFAGNALAPPVMIDYFLNKKPFDASLVQKKFNISYEAASKYRKADYEAWLSTNLLDSEYNILFRYIHNHSFKHCPICKSNIHGEDVHFCKICGNKNIKACQLENSSTYKTVEVDESSKKAHQCPRCNKDTAYTHLHCTFCTVHVINSCVNRSCNKLADGNARYCSHCGSTTWFYEELSLPRWQEDIPETETTITPDFFYVQ